MGILTLGPISTNSALCPILAHLSLVHRSLNKALRAQEIYERSIYLAAATALLLARLLRFFDWRDWVLLGCGDKSLSLLNIHSLEGIDFGRHKLRRNLKLVRDGRADLERHAVHWIRCRSTRLHAQTNFKWLRTKLEWQNMISSVRILWTHRRGIIEIQGHLLRHKCRGTVGVQLRRESLRCAGLGLVGPRLVLYPLGRVECMSWLHLPLISCKARLHRVCLSVVLVMLNKF